MVPDVNNDHGQLASVATADMALMMSGPPALPRSLHSRQPPRNWARPRLGDASAPRVITMPAERPLPKPIRAATAAMAAGVAVSGNSKMPAPRMIKEGAA